MKLNIGLTSQGRFELPDDFLLRSAVIYGAPESGKTTTAAVIAEEAWNTVHIPFVALDPKGDWWGVKSTRDGKSAGIPAIIFGGDHADLPLDETAAALIAGVVARLEQPVIIDMEHLSKGKQIRFVAVFLEKLYELNRRPRLLIADEAQRWAPQKPISPDHTICLGAAEDIAKLGRKHGLGRLFVTQRGAGFNKEVAELMDVMIAHRTPGVLDQERVREWLQANMGKAATSAVMEPTRAGATQGDAPLIAGLRKGECFIASAHPDMKMFERVQVRNRTTFDSSATPELGKKRSEPKVLAQPDLEALRTEMADSIERAKHDDPKELRKQLAEAQKQINTLTRELESATRTVEKVVTVETVKPIPEDLLRDIETDADFISKGIDLLQDGAQRMHEHWLQLHHHNQTKPQTTEKVEQVGADRGIAMAPSGRVAPVVPRRAVPTSAPTVSSEGLTMPQQRILDALAWLELITHYNSQHWTIVAMLANQSPKSSGFANNVSVLRVAGLVEGRRSLGLSLTPDGQRHAATPNMLLDNAELHNSIKAKLTAPQGRILDFLVRKGEPALERWETVADRSEQSPTSSGFANNVSVLRSMGLLRGNRGQGLEASTILFLNGRR